MSYPISNTVKTVALACLGAVALVLSMEYKNVSFAQGSPDADSVLAMDTDEIFEVDSEIFDSLLIVVTAAFLATDGNLEVAVLDDNSVCISAQRENCSDQDAPENHNMAKEVESKEVPVTILTAYDQ